ncbi:unnamed protein product [Brassica oleracea]
MVIHSCVGHMTHIHLPPAERAYPQLLRPDPTRQLHSCLSARFLLDSVSLSLFTVLLLMSLHFCKFVCNAFSLYLYLWTRPV